MSLEEYEVAWRARGSTAPLRNEMDNLVKNITRGQRRHRWILSIFAATTVAGWVVVAAVLALKRAGSWTEVLPALALQAIATAGLVILGRRQQARRRALALTTETIRDAARIGLETTNHEIRDGRLLLGVGIAAVPLLAAAVSQLKDSGKMDTNAAMSFTALCLLIAAVNVCIQWWRYRRTLAPRRRRLEEVLTALREEPGV